MNAQEVGAPALLDALFRHAPLGLGFWDAELRCRRINPALAAINGTPPEATLGRTMPEVLGPLGLELESLFRTVMDTLEPMVDVDVVGQTPAQPGVDRHWRATYYPVLGDDGAVEGVAAAVLEVTAEQRASEREQSALQQARAATALLDVVVESAPVGIGFLDRELIYQRANAALAKISATTVEAMLGRTPSEAYGEVGEKVEVLHRQVMETGEAVFEVEVSGELLNRPGEIHHREGSWFPVFDAAGRVAGVGGVIRDVTERHRSDRERQRLLKDAVTARAHAEAAQIRAESAQAAAEDARREAEQARARTEFLAEAGRRMARSMDYETTLQEVAQSVVPGLADWCAVSVQRPGGHLESVAVAHSDPERTERAREIGRRYPPRAEAPRGIGEVMRSGRHSLVEGITDEMLAAAAHDAEHLEILRELGMRSVLMVPLRTPGSSFGAISLILTGEDRRFSEDDIVMAQTLADRAALHIRNSQLYTERSHIARTLQASLLPRALPEIPGMEIAARYLAAGDQNEVGGDFYDAFPSDDGVWTAMIGDVAGKGPEAAALTSLTRHTLRTAAMHADRPAENLRTLNRALMAEVSGSRFCTVVYGRICPSDVGGALLSLATGGHPAPRVIRADGTVEAVRVRGSLVGWLEEPTFGEIDVRLAPGDAIVMFTDGVIEVRGRGSEYGEQQLDATLAELGGAGAEEIVETVLRRAVEMHGSTVPDDIALLAIRALQP